MTRTPVLRCLLAAFAALLFLVADAPGEPPLVRAAGMVVNTLADTNPPVTDGLCSLREAITNANANAATFPDCPAGTGADTITFSVSGTIVLAATLPEITDSAGLTIDGSGQSVSLSGNEQVRVFTVGTWCCALVRAQFVSLTVSKGYAPLTGGGIYIHCCADVVIRDSTVTGNRTTGGSGSGAGVFNSGTLSVVNSLISSNVGGALWSGGDPLLVADSTITDNSGGGIYALGNVIVRDSLISKNTGGAAVYAGENSAVVNSTVSGNSDGGVRGGGLELNATKVLNSTIAGNGWGGLLGALNVANTIVTGSSVLPDCNGTLLATGPNLLGNLTGCTIVGTPPIIGDPKLGPLADNGGPTKTHALLPGSPAIDVGSDALCAASPVNGRDQRGIPRPQSAHCDLGAFELPSYLSINDVSSFEGKASTTTYAFVVTRSLALITATVHVATANGAAIAGSDYVAIPDTILTFAPGETSKPVTVLVNGDITPEANETFVVNLSNPTGALIADGQGVGTILDDDTPGAIIVDKVTLPAGDPQSFSFTPSYGAPFALTDTAPPNNSGPLLMGVYSVAETVPAGWVQTSAVCSDGSPVSAINLSPGETVTCTFTNVKKGNLTLQNVMVGGTATFSYSGTPNGAITINGGTLTELVAPGTHVTTQVTPAGWTLISVTCDDGDSGGVVASGQVTFQVAPGENVTCIVTNTKAAISVDDVSVTEGDSGTKLLTFTVARSAGLFVHDVAVDYATQDVSASAGSDYVAANGTLTIPKTSSSGTVSVAINGDTEFEIDETLKLLLSNPKNAVLTTPFGTGTILNDDAPSNPIGGKNLSITTGSIDLSWETGTTQTAYALLQYNTSTGVPVIINLPGTATSYSDAAATNGVVYCYVLAALGPGGAFLGLSDLLCGMAGAESGTVIPQGFSLTLNQNANATMTWTTPPGDADRYLLERIPLDGSPITNVPLGGAATSTAQAVVAGTCFQLVAFKGASFGTSDVLCGVPGVSTLNAGAGAAGGRTASEALSEVAARLVGMGGVRVEELALP